MSENLNPKNVAELRIAAAAPGMSGARLVELILATLPSRSSRLAVGERLNSVLQLRGLDLVYSVIIVLGDRERISDPSVRMELDELLAPHIENLRRSD